MKRLQLYIAHFLLAGFLFPQVANAVHYLIQSHSFSNHIAETSELSAPSYHYHDCDYQFKSLKYYVSPGNGFESAILPNRQRQEQFFYKTEFVNELAFHYSLRGPPGLTG